MDKKIVVRLHSSFEAMVQSHPDTAIEFWLARDLQMLLGYTQWRNFEVVIKKAVTACHLSGTDPENHFARMRKVVGLGSGSQREVEDIALTRYACYLIAQNGDPSKDQIAFAQTYFAVQTRKQELIEKRLVESERLSARRRLHASEKELSGIIFERLRNNESFARIRSNGDQALFGGKSTQDMKSKLSVPKGRPLADFLPTITIKAKDFANEITNFNIKQKSLSTESSVSSEHVKNNKEVRNLLVQRGITPESLPPDEDVKKVQRRLAKEQKSLPSNTKKLDVPGDHDDE